MNIIAKTKTFFKEVRLEVKKVNWLSRNELVNYTLLVIIFIVAMAFFFGVLDYFFGNLLTRFILSRQ